jgi:hypothetical protein
MRRPTLLFIFITAGVGLGLFQLKYQVMNLEQHHHRVQKTIRETKETMHVLKAEWAHLNDPKRLQNLSERYLTIAPIQGSQLISLRQVTGKESGYDRGALDQLVADLAADNALADLAE